MKKLLPLAVLAALSSVHVASAQAADVSAAVGATGQSGMTYRLGLSWDWDKSWWQTSTGRLTGYWDAGYTYWEGGDEGAGKHSLSFAPVFVYEFAGDSIKPFIEAGIGVAAFSGTRVGDQNLGSSLNFEDRIGAGLKFANGQSVGVRAIHYSNAGLKQLLVLGGSLGAEPLNKLLPEALAQVPLEIRPAIRHQAGRQHAEITAERYRTVAVEADVAPFISDMAAAYAWADLVICRAGALTVSELTAAGLPAFLVPLPHAIDDHQTRNAEFLVRSGAGRLLPQKSTGAAELAAQLSEVLMHPETLRSMADQARSLAKPEATRTVVDACLEVARG